MGKKNKVVILPKKVPKKVVNLFGNVHNKLGIYDKNKVEMFKKKLIEKYDEYSERIYFLFDDIDDALESVTASFFDKLIDKIDGSKKNDNVVVVKSEDIKQESIVEYDIGVKSISSRRINFEDLEPLGQFVDDEDDVLELQTLRMELLLNGDEFHNSNVIKRKK